MLDSQKYLDAQNHGLNKYCPGYATALAEILCGQKESHWIWYVFPQIQGLGRSEQTRYFALADLEEARAYYAHPVLGARLVEICCALLSLGTRDPMVVLGDPDCYKLRSCMTLFQEAVPEEPVFRQVLEEFCMGTPDDRTLRILAQQEPSRR